MPKVNENHYEKKKQEILEAAKRVCLSKPLYNVGMRDIVVEAGMSQGGVYKYFSNIDDLYVALLNQYTLTHDVEVEIDSIIDECKEPMEILRDFMSYIGSYIQRAVEGSDKIYFELMTLYANEPERFMKIKDQLIEVSVLEYLYKKMVTFILLNIETQHFQPNVPVEDIFAFMMTTINGIAHEATLAFNLPKAQRLMPEPNINKLIKTLSFAVCEMLRTTK